MVNNDSTSITKPTLSPAELLTQVTALCNELDQLMILHDHYYRAVESVFSSRNNDETEQPTQSELSVFPSWLQDREIAAIDVVYQLQEALRNDQ